MKATNTKNEQKANCQVSNLFAEMLNQFSKPVSELQQKDSNKKS